MDKNLDALVREVRLLIKFLLEAKGESEKEKGYLTARDYIANNSEIINKGLLACQQLPREGQNELYKTFRLSESVLETDWHRYCSGIIHKAIDWQLIDPLNKTRLLHFSVSELEPLVQVLDYSKYIVDTSEYVLVMHPIIKYLPRRIFKSITLREGTDTFIGFIRVCGGLTDENKAAFELLRFDLIGREAPINTDASAVVNITSIDPPPNVPFETTLYIPKESLDLVLYTLRHAGYEIYFTK